MFTVIFEGVFEQWKQISSWYNTEKINFALEPTMALSLLTFSFFPSAIVITNFSYFKNYSRPVNDAVCPLNPMFVMIGLLDFKCGLFLHASFPVLVSHASTKCPVLVFSFWSSFNIHTATSWVYTELCIMWPKLQNHSGELSLCKWNLTWLARILLKEINKWGPAKNFTDYFCFIVGGASPLFYSKLYIF